MVSAALSLESFILGSELPSCEDTQAALWKALERWGRTEMDL
jgi:hypothetical protein